MCCRLKMQVVELTVSLSLLFCRLKMQVVELTAQLTDIKMLADRHESKV